MNSEDLLLGKADQLMRRHRSFVASAKGGAGEPAGEEDVDEDLPLLTEVVSSAAERASQNDGALRLGLEPLLALQRAAMLREFERWLDEQLPQVVASAMDGITDRLLGLITRRARAELLPRLEAVAVQTGKPGRETPEEGGGQPV